MRLGAYTPRSDADWGLGDAQPGEESDLLAARAAVAELADEAGDEHARDRRVALDDVEQREREPLGVDVLQQVAGRAGADRVEEVVVLARDGQHHHSRLRQACGDLPGRGDAAAGHADVEQADLGQMAHRRVDGRRRVGHVGTDAEGPMLLQRRADVGAGRRVVVCDENRDSLHGSTRSTRVPAPGADFTSSLAPRARARSCMVCRPKVACRRGAEVSKPMPSSLTRRYG